ncbi:MAG: hypothetical protein AB7S70_13735 [Hyphomicrobium sp.]|uniref:hypothetical protein n=1 Tax=Hyphomicrobium sp. TaxID=82 RepID=UPI003D14B0A1
MTSNLKVRAITLLVSVALTIDQAMAMSWLFPGWGDKSPGTPGVPSATPELDSAGAIAVFALVASVAIVLYNRMRNR